MSTAGKILGALREELGHVDDQEELVRVGPREEVRHVNDWKEIRRVKNGEEFGYVNGERRLVASTTGNS